jgi:hypothetical protein
LTHYFDLSIKEIDDLLQHLYVKLKGKKEGLSLVEPAAILLEHLKNSNPAFYRLQLTRFTPVVTDALISKAHVSFGYEGLKSLQNAAGDIFQVTSEYVPTGVEESLGEIKEKVAEIESILAGKSVDTDEDQPFGAMGRSGRDSFFRERAWGAAEIPLVSTYSTGENSFSTGRVVTVRIEVRITGEWSARRRCDPVISFEHISAGPNSLFERQIHTAVKAAERHAASAMKMKGILRVPREYKISLPEIASFPDSAIQHLSGGSAGLAVASLLVTVLSRLDLSGKRLWLLSGTASTGMINDSGGVMDVEDSYVADKVRSAFFSKCSRLVLPEGNMATARKELSSLSERWPERKLDLISAFDLSSTCENTDVVASHGTPMGKPMLQRLFFWRKHAMAGLAPAAMALLVVFILPPYLDHKVSSVDIINSRIEMRNKYGRLVSIHSVGFKLIQFAGSSRIYRHDIDGREGDEIITIISESRQISSEKYRSNRLHFLAFDDEGTLMQNYIYNQEEIMGGEMDPWADQKTIMMIPSDAVFLDELGKGTVAVGISHATYTPASLVKVDLNRGESETFFHKGFFPVMTARDFDGDGRREILLAGYNLSLDASVVIVIDPAHMEGSSPRGHGYSVPGKAADIAKYYVKLPKFRLYERYHTSMYPFGVSLLEDSDTLRIAVKSKAEDVKYSITEDMRFVGAEVVLSHGMGANRPDSISIFDYPGKERDEQELLEGVRYWNGARWSRDRAMNRSYLAHIDKAVDRSIVTVDHDINHIVMKDALGEVVASHDVGFRTPESSAYRRAFFGDHLDNEGDEIIFTLINSLRIDRNDPNRNKLYILVFDEAGELLRRHIYHEERVMGEEAEMPVRIVGMQMILSSSPFEDKFGPGTLFLATHHKTEPPASLIKFSLDDGSYETFFHRGFIREIAPRDVDGDESIEIVMTGYNVALDAPVVIVLDSELIDGSSPSGAGYSVKGRERDIAKYYVKLPHFERFDLYNSRVYPLHASILENGERLKIIVESRAEEVIYTIDDGMIFTDAEVVNAIHNRKGLPDSLCAVAYPQKEEDEVKLLSGIRFWDGSDWIEQPTVNRSYLEHANEGATARAGKDN